jgi:hypothetical protein
MWVSKDSAPYEGNVMFVDPSGRGKDETSYAAVKVTSANSRVPGSAPVFFD